MLKDLTKYWMIVMGENWHWEFLGYQVCNLTWGKSGRKNEQIPQQVLHWVDSVFRSTYAFWHSEVVVLSFQNCIFIPVKSIHSMQILFFFFLNWRSNHVENIHFFLWFFTDNYFLQISLLKKNLANTKRWHVQAICTFT